MNTYFNIKLLLLLFWATTSFVEAADFSDLTSIKNFSGPQGWWGSVQVSLLTESQAQSLFQELKSRREFAWDYPADQCYAKAYLGSYLLSRAGIKSLTVWSISGQDTPLLRVETANDPKGCTNWVYHVAMAVAVQFPDGAIQGKVIDPALASGPIDLWAWVGMMTGHFSSTQKPVVWTSHPYTYRKEDLGNSESNKLLTSAEFKLSYVEKYKKLLAQDRKKVDSPHYQEQISKVKSAIASGNHPARQIPDPCPAQKSHPTDFEFVGTIESPVQGIHF